MSILVLGTVALDTVKTPSGVRKFMLGGSAVHFAMSARIFSDVNLVAIIGRDFPSKHIDFLRNKGIDISSLMRTEGSTFKWEGKYEGDLNTAVTLNTELGVLATFSPSVREHQRKIKYVFLANVDPEMQMHLLTSMHSPELVGLDSMNFWIENKRDALLRLLKKVTIYVANDREAKDLSGETNLIKAAKCLHALGPKMVVIKKGEHGVFLYSNKFIFSLPAYPTDRVVDPTGAGDTFAGGFMGYLAKAKKINETHIRRALAYGTVAASFNVEGFGTESTSSLTVKAIRERLEKLRKISLF